MANMANMEKGVVKLILLSNTLERGTLNSTGLSDVESKGEIFLQFPRPFIHLLRILRLEESERAFGSTLVSDMFSRSRILVQWESNDFYWQRDERMLAGWLSSSFHLSSTNEFED